MKCLLGALLLLLLPVAAAAQSSMTGGSSAVLTSSGAPAGSCAANALDVDITTGNLYTCNAGTWQGVTGGSGCTVSGTINQLVANNGSTGCQSSVATVTTGGNFSTTQAANGNDMFFGFRATDSSPTGNFIHLQNHAKNADLLIADINGNLTLAGSVTTGANGGIGGTITLPEGTAASASASNDVCYADSTAHALKCSWNNGSFVAIPQLAGDLSGTSASPTVSKINGGSFTGTNGDVVGFGASNTPADTGLTYPTAAGTARVVQVIASGTITINPGGVSGTSCSSAQTATATGAAATDTVKITFAADPTGTTGYTPSAMVTLVPYITTNTLNVKVCNLTGSTITPSSIAPNFEITR